MFGLGTPICPALEVPLGAVNAAPVVDYFGSADPNPSPLQSVQEQHHDAFEARMIDVEGPHGLGDTSIPNLVNDLMHDAHAEASLGQRHDTQHV